MVFTAIMFVDDSDFTLYANHSEENITIVSNRQQATVDSWSHGLTVSGGSLKPETYFWFPIEWKWKKME